MAQVPLPPAEHERSELLAEDRLSEAAAADPRVLEQARTNTRAMLTALLGSLGFTDIEIVFADPAAEGS